MNMAQHRVRIAAKSTAPGMGPLPLWGRGVQRGDLRLRARWPYRKIFGKFGAVNLECQMMSVDMLLGMVLGGLAVEAVIWLWDLITIHRFGERNRD
jgi:hypothetical protein